MSAPKLCSPPLGYEFCDEPWQPREGYALAWFGTLETCDYDARFIEIGEGANTWNCRWIRPIGAEAIKRADDLAAENERLRDAIKSAIDWIEQGETFTAESVLTEAIR